MRMTSAFLIVCFSLISSKVHLEDWSRFQGLNGQGFSTVTGFPVEFNRQKNFFWRTPGRYFESFPEGGSLYE